MLESAGFTSIQIARNYFDDETIDEYVKSAGSTSCCGASDAQALVEAVKVEMAGMDRAALKESVFSANISAYKP
jgi:predicted house-cleaning NTP pyrophosphatase (Maf/HAM1 superfamily)